ncbi:hypothetical protein QIS99_12275 [Streptomyces sp. B-S-A8]|uniref:Tetratricopeptide repeat protein n=1 Tax=Streptomyces solicavernae TaxID=3043614 RepID=A0ABT6RRA7_9ACTN|nr:hypothetical protein [Streptomyces sp. B-S-A8]MDI3386969.1 hypothetical protein [Streptomyces sp. B-S-A8]
MASSPMTSSAGSPRPNLAFRRLRGQLSPGEFAAAVRRAGLEIGERVACDARYIGRVEAGEIRCPNYAYERVFLHLFPGRTLADLGFAPRESVRGRSARVRTGTGAGHPAGPYPYDPAGPYPYDPADPYPYGLADRYPPDPYPHDRLNAEHPSTEESDVLRRAFMTGSTATVAAASLGLTGPLKSEAAAAPRRVGQTEADAVEEAVRRIRLLDDRHGADGLYRRAAAPLRNAFALLDAGTARRSTSERLHAGAGELAISVGWLAHDSGRFDDARSHYAEALATARMAGDAALEAHAFCNMSFLARDAGRPREAVRAAQAAQRSARERGSTRLLSLLALREAGAYALLGDRAGCEQALLRAQALFGRGDPDGDPEWMSFYHEAELEGLEAQCWSALGQWARAARHAQRAAHVAATQTPHFTRNIALYTAEAADDLARAGRPDEAAEAGSRVLDLLDEVQSSRIQSILATTARVLLPHRRNPTVATFLDRHAHVPRQA